MAIETNSQQIFLTSSAVIPRPHDICSPFKCSDQKGKRRICFPPVIFVDSLARGPPISALGKYVQKVGVFFTRTAIQELSKAAFLKNAHYSRLVVRV